MSRPLPPAILALNLADWGRTLKLLLEASPLLEDGSEAYPELTEFSVELSADGEAWIPAGSGSDSFMDVPTAAVANAPTLWVRAYTHHFGAVSAPASGSVESFLQFATAREPRGIYMRPGVYPERGPVSSQDMLDDFRAFAATDHAMFGQLQAIDTSFESWVTHNLANLSSAKDQLRKWKDER